MSISRRDFLKLGGAVTASSLLGILSLSGCKKLKSKLKNSKACYGVCSLCSIGCGIIVFYNKKEIVYIQGDPAHPVNQGSLCQKGQSLIQLYNNKKRLSKIKYRAAYSEKWSEISWEQAIDKIAHNIKKTRDETFIEKEKELTVNRTDGIVSIAGNNLTNEEAYLFTKFSRLLGVSATTCREAILNADVETVMQNVFGLDAMTNSFSDIVNSNLAVFIGFDPAADAGVLFKKLLKAKEQGAKILTVDTKITRTAAASTNYIQLAPGADLVFLNGIINYILQNEKFNKNYLIANTDVSYLVNHAFEYNHANNLFSGFDKRIKKYQDKTSWEFMLDGRGNPKHDDDLLHKNCVFQIIKDYFARYSIDFVTVIAGCSVDQFLEVAELIASTGTDSQSATIYYGGGILKQSNSGQIIHALSIIQLLLANIGVAGGGIFSGKYSGNEQGISDQIGAWNNLPGKLFLPENNLPEKDRTLRSYLQKNKKLTNDPLSINQWGMYDKFFISLLKSWFNESSSGKDKYNFKFLPIAKNNYDFDSFLNELKDGKIIKGLIMPGFDFLNIGLHKEKLKESLVSVDWIMISDIWENETASFWQDNKWPAGKIKTEVFLLPTLSSLEKTGTYTSADRNIQFNQGVESRFNTARNELWIFNNLFEKIKSIYAKEKGVASHILNKANWKYDSKNIVRQITNEISGISEKNKQLTSSMELKSDGSTSCGNWLYCGMTSDEVDFTARRNEEKGNSLADLLPDWGWSWPDNVRILYNRASINRQGKPVAPEKWVIIKKDNQILGDVIHGKDKSINSHPFLLKPDGIASIFCKKNNMGPLPVYFSKKDIAPVNYKIKYIEQIFDRYSKQYPYDAFICGLKDASIYKNMDWPGELRYDNFCEISRKTALLMNIKNNNKLIIRSIFGKIKLPVFINEGIDNSSMSKAREYVYIYGLESLKIVPQNVFYLRNIPIKIEKEVI